MPLESLILDFFVGSTVLILFGPFVRKSFSFTFLRVGPGQINVSVMDSDGIPIEKTQVLVYGSEGTLSEKVVGPSGLVSFDSVSFGNRGVRVVPPRSYLDIDEGFFFQHGLIIDEDWTEEVNFKGLLEQLRNMKENYS